MKVKIKKLSQDAIIPQKATAGSVAYDVFIPKETEISIGRQVIPLDISLEMENGYEAKIEPRSGYSSKGMEGRISSVTSRFNADVLVGKIDPDYRGNIGVIINNNDLFKFVLDKGTRIAQMTFYKTEDAEFSQVDDLVVRTRKRRTGMITLKEVNELREKTKELFERTSDYEIKLKILYHLSDILNHMEDISNEGIDDLEKIVTVQGDSQFGFGKNNEWYKNWFPNYYESNISKFVNDISMIAVLLLYYSSIYEYDFVLLKSYFNYDFNKFICSGKEDKMRENHTFIEMIFRLAKTITNTKEIYARESFILNSLEMLCMICHVWNIDLWRGVRFTICYLTYKK